jgi:hypothetical protein
MLLVVLCVRINERHPFVLLLQASNVRDKTFGRPQDEAAVAERARLCGPGGVLNFVYIVTCGNQFRTFPPLDKYFLVAGLTRDFREGGCIHGKVHRSSHLLLFLLYFLLHLDSGKSMRL